MKTIEVTISPKGEVVIDAKGFTGNECIAATKPIEDALGTATKRQPKPEMHTRASRTVEAKG